MCIYFFFLKEVIINGGTLLENQKKNLTKPSNNGSPETIKTNLTGYKIKAENTSVTFIHQPDLTWIKEKFLKFNKTKENS